MNEPQDQNTSMPPEMAEILEKAFADFQERADKLSSAYESMQADFRNLNIELDRKNTELAETLARQEETQTYLNSILESMTSGVIGVDVMGNVTRFNRAASDITGYESEEVLGKPYGEVFASGGKKELGLHTVLSEGKGHMLDEKSIGRKDGYSVPVSFQSALLRDQRSRTLGAVEIFSDISRIKALEEEMQRTKTMAALGEMSATVAHEIRNPLGAMGVWAGLLDRDFEPDDKRRTTLKKIIDGLGRLNRIVSNLLVYSRPFEARLRDVVLRDVLEETVSFVEIEIERLGQSVSVFRQWNENEAVVVRADPEKLQQVIMNLCFNAVQAMPDGGELHVAIDPCPATKRGNASFVVRDTGMGIDSDRLGKIFDPFHTTKENGTGLGLAIVKKFIDHHSGYIGVESKVNEGTAFTVFLPKVQEEGQNGR